MNRTFAEHAEPAMQWAGLSARRLRIVLYGLGVISTALAITVWYAVARGQDFNWDQRNYHIGIPFLLAHGTFWNSIDPAGVQSYFNPYVLQLQFWAIRHLGPIEFAVALAGAQSLAFMIAGQICAEIARPAEGWREFSLGLLGFVLCLMAPISLSESGTTFIDLATSVPVLAAYAVLLARGRLLGLAGSGLVAGILLGTATALKLTNAVFALGAVGFALAGRESARQRLGWLLICGIASVLSFAAVGGSWHLALWERFGNPFFPFYNNIFRSPDFSLVEISDARFLPHSLLDVWRYPLYWLLGGSPTQALPSPSAELSFRDARWVVAVFGGTGFLAALPIFRRWSSRQLREPATGLFFALTIDYLIWLAMFGIQRYILPSEILCGAAVLVLVMLVRPYPLRLVLLLAVTVLSWDIILVPDWGHLPWRSSWQGISPKPVDLGGRSLVFLTASPGSLVAASLPADALYVGLSGDFDLAASSDNSLARQLKRELGPPADLRLWSVDQGTVPPSAAAILAGYGLAVSGQCKALDLGSMPFRICSVEHRR